MKNNNSARQLPKNILGSSMNPESLESQEVIAKYGSPDAVISEESVDAVALIYMNSEAILYWLPHFFDYIRNRAEPESLHVQSMLFKLSDNSWVYNIKELASDTERSTIRDFLQWLGTHPHVTDTTDLIKAQYAYAVELWR